MKKRRVYGPVPSRRFGLSLGIDLVPHKTCCLDCNYCQVGPTTTLTTQRKDFFQLDHIVADLQTALDSGPTPKLITLAGSGEPTLYKSLGKLIRQIRELTEIPIMMLTNGMMLFDEQIAADALLVDILSPSLDAGDERTFNAINRPHASLNFERTIQGLRTVTAKHPGVVRLEVMLVKGINDGLESLRNIAGLIKSLSLKSVDINTPVRPVTSPDVLTCDHDTLSKAQTIFGPEARIVAEFTGVQSTSTKRSPTDLDVYELVSRRPSTLEDMQLAMGFDRDKLVQVIGQLEQQGRISSYNRVGKVFYRISKS